jgi:hypothetical protein
MHWTGGLTDKTLRLSAALAFCLPEPIVVSCSGFVDAV